MAELDRCQSEWREEIVAAYERSVTENMEALATCLGAALDRDLIGADDFAPPPRGLITRPRGAPSRRRTGRARTGIPAGSRGRSGAPT